MANSLVLTHCSQSDAPLTRQVSAFLVDRHARQLSPRTLEWYREKLSVFECYAAEQDRADLAQATPALIRQYLLHLQASHNAGGVHGFFRALRALMNWYELEYEPQGWKNPLRRVRAPKVPAELVEPAPLGDISRMINQCSCQMQTGLRDRALMYFLLDTGARAQECLDMSLGDVSLTTGQCQVLHGKGNKARFVFLSDASRDALRAYLEARNVTDPLAPLWVTVSGTRLQYAGLREIVRRRAKQAGVPAPSLHSFRRAFALGCLRQGMDIFSLQRLMGHADLTVLRRYLAQTPEDLRRAHAKYGPVAGAFGQSKPHHPAADSRGGLSGGLMPKEEPRWN